MMLFTFHRGGLMVIWVIYFSIPLSYSNVNHIIYVILAYGGAVEHQHVSFPLGFCLIQ